MMGIVVGGSNCADLTCFFEFFRFFVVNMCFNITVGPNNITLGCCSNGSRYVSRNWFHWSHLLHPECNMHNSSTVDICLDDGEDSWDWDVILLLVFLLLSLLFGIIGMWRRRRRGRCVGRRREREELDDQEGEGGVEMKETTVYLVIYIYLFNSLADL